VRERILRGSMDDIRAGGRRYLDAGIDTAFHAPRRVEHQNVKESEARLDSLNHRHDRALIA